MARTPFVTLLAFLVLAVPAQATFVKQEKNTDWPPTTDFSLTDDPCATGDCNFTAMLTFHYKGENIGSIPLESPAHDGGKWDTKRFGHVDFTNFVQFFWACDSPGTYTWTADITKTANGKTQEHSTESGSWKQPGCSPGKPRIVSKAFAVKTAKEKVIFGNRKNKHTTCARKKRIGRWSCSVTWQTRTRRCTDKQSLFFYTRKIFFRRFQKVSSFRDSRSCVHR